MTTIDQLNARGQGYLPGLIGIEFISIEPGSLTSRLPIRPELLAPNGYLHAAVVIALADTTCGYGTFTDLPNGAQNFTTIELKSNFLGTAREGVISRQVGLRIGRSETNRSGVTSGRIAKGILGRHRNRRGRSGRHRTRNASHCQSSGATRVNGNRTTSTGDR